MAKNQETATAEENIQAEAAPAAEATQKTHEVVTLTGKTSDDIFRQFKELKKNHPDDVVITGAVARSKETGEYSLRIDINP